MKLFKKYVGYSVKVQNPSPERQKRENEGEAVFKKIMVKIFFRK